MPDAGDYTIGASPLPSRLLCASLGRCRVCIGPFFAAFPGAAKFRPTPSLQMITAMLCAKPAGSRRSGFGGFCPSGPRCVKSDIAKLVCCAIKKLPPHLAQGRGLIEPNYLGRFLGSTGGLVTYSNQFAKTKPAPRLRVPVPNAAYTSEMPPAMGLTRRDESLQPRSPL